MDAVINNRVQFIIKFPNGGACMQNLKFPQKKNYIPKISTRKRKSYRLY